MGFDPTVRTQTILPPEDHTWMKDAHGFDEAVGITLDGALLGAVFTNGVVPSGVHLAKVTATGRYGPYDDAQAPGDGRGVCAGILRDTQQIQRADLGDATNAFVNTGAAMMIEAHIIESKLPTNHGLDAAAKVDLAGRVIYL